MPRLSPRLLFDHYRKLVLLDLNRTTSSNCTEDPKGQGFCKIDLSQPALGETEPAVPEGARAVWGMIRTRVDALGTGDCILHIRGRHEEDHTQCQAICFDETTLKVGSNIRLFFMVPIKNRELWYRFDVAPGFQLDTFIFIYGYFM